MISISFFTSLYEVSQSNNPAMLEDFLSVYLELFVH